MNVQEFSNDVTNAAQNVALKAQDLANNTTDKIKNIGERLQNVSQNAKQTASNTMLMISSMLCSPALVYLVIGLTTLSSSFIGGMDASMFGIRLLKLVLWTYCVNYLCQNGYTNISWGIVMIPYALVPLHMMGIVKFPKKYLYAFLSQDEQEFFGF